MLARLLNTAKNMAAPQMLKGFHWPNNSKQEYTSKIIGKNICTGHSECDAILDGNGSVIAQPSLVAENPDAALIHEAAIGKIAGEQILKLRTLGLTAEQAEEKIISGFLK